MIYNCYSRSRICLKRSRLSPATSATGTPAGVGALRQPFPTDCSRSATWLTIWIHGIGTLGDAVVEAPEGYLAPEIYAAAAWVH